MTPSIGGASFCAPTRKLRPFEFFGPVTRKELFMKPKQFGKTLVAAATLIGIGVLGVSLNAVAQYRGDGMGQGGMGGGGGMMGGGE